MVVLAARLWGRFLAAKSHFQCTTKLTWRTRKAPRTVISTFKYIYQPENTKKKIRVTGTLKQKLKRKISSMSTIETRLFWPYSYILWKVVNRNTRYMSIILVANIIWRSGHAIRSSFLLDFSFLHHNSRVGFTVFFVTAM